VSKNSLVLISLLAVAAFGDSLSLFTEKHSAPVKDSVVTLDYLLVVGFKHKDFSAAPASTDKVLAEDPEVSLIRRGPSAGEPVVCGSSGNDINVTLDGARMQFACTDHMDPVTSYVEDNDIADVEIQTGARALAQGGSALGLVDIQLQKAALGPIGLEWKFGGQGSSIDNGANGNARLAFSSPRFAAQISGSAKYLGDYFVPGGEKIPYSGLHAGNLFATSTIGLSKNWEINVTGLYDRFWNAGYPSLPMDVGFSEARHGAVGFENTGLPWLTWSGLAYTNSTSHAMDDTHRPDVPMHMDMPGAGSTTGAWNLLEIVKGDHHFDFRVEGWESVQSASMTMYDYPNPSMYLETWPKTSTDGFKGSLTGDLHLTDKLRLETGATLEAQSVNLVSQVGRRQVNVVQPGSPYQRLFVFPGFSAGLRHIPSPGNTTDVTFSYSSRAPAMDELYGYFLFNALTNRDYIGNARLIPENIAQGQITSTFAKGPVFIKGAMWAYVNEHTIEAADAPDIPSMSYGAYGSRQWQNGTLSKHAGGELEIRYSPFNNVEFRCVTHADKAWADPGYEEPIVSESGGTLLSLFKTKFLTIVPEVDWAPSQGGYSVGSSFAKTPGYAIAHLRLKGKIPCRFSISWRAGIENVFDQTWNSSLDWERFSTRTPLYRPGRSFYAGFEINGSNR
jgi:iron complex outermembrane receptor protein